MPDHDPQNEQEFTGKLDWRLWRGIAAFMRPYRRYAIGFAFIALALGASNTGFNLITRAVIDDVVVAGNHARLLHYAWAYAALVAFTVLGIFLFVRIGGVMATGISRDIRRAGFKRLQELSFSFYDQHSTGWLISRMTSDCERLSNILTWGMLDIVWCTAMMSTVSVILLVLDWKLALLTLGIVPFMGIVSLYFQRVILKSSREVRKHNSRLTAAYDEGIMGVETTKTLVREEANLQEFGTIATDMHRASVRNALQSAVFWPLLTILSSIGGGLALHFGGADVLAGTLSLGTLVIFIAYTREFFVPITELSRVITEIQAAQAAAERIVSLIETVPEVRDSDAVAQRIAQTAQAALHAQSPPAGAQPLALDGYPTRIGQIEFRNVTFAYANGRIVLRNFNLTVQAGQRIALVGPTGGGKTTTVSLLCRFYEPTAGEILIDGVEYRQRSLAWLQQQLGVVLQTPHLFTGSIRENIRYGRLAATDAEVEAAARLVDAHDFILEMEHGYESRVGQGGVNLSTGQKQLVSFARAVLADPQIFVMDEATSSIDTPTEVKIQQGLETVLHGRTSFIIAHRLSTIRSADRIIVIENGELTESGTHEELLAQGGHYHELYTQQFTTEKEDQVLGRAEKTSA